MFKAKGNKKEKGQGLVEYALILVLVAIVVIVVLMVLGPRIGIVFAQINAVGDAGHVYCSDSEMTLVATPSTLDKWVADGFIVETGSRLPLFDDPNNVLVCAVNS